MCNEAACLRALGEISAAFSQLKIPLTFPEGSPNLGRTDSIRITDPAAIVRLHDGAHQLVQRRWSWAGPSSGGRPGKPVYNYRSEGRRFGNAAAQGRCLIPLDGFYEFTDAAPGAKRKTKWLFTMPAYGTGSEDRALFCVAGLWRGGVDLGRNAGGADAGGATGEAFTMLTTAPGPDVAAYHARQIVVMPRDRWADWLGGEVPAADLIAPTPAGTFVVTPAR